MNKIKSLLKPNGISIVVSGLILASFIIFTDPLSLPLTLLFLPFVLAFIFLRNVGLVIASKLFGESSERKRRVVVVSITSILVLVLVLQSLGQLSWRDLIIVLGLIVGLVLYFSKTDLL